MDDTFLLGVLWCCPKALQNTLLTFSILNTFWFVFLQFFLYKAPKTFSSLIWLITYVHGTVFLTFLITKLLQTNLKCKLLQKHLNLLIISPTLNLGSLSSHFSTRINTSVWFYINRFHFNCAAICIIVFINYIILFININIFWYWSHVFINFVFYGSNNSSATTNFLSLSVEYVSVLLFCKNDFIDLLQNSLPLTIHIFFVLRIGSSKNFWKASVNVTPYLLKVSVPSYY